MVIRQRGTGWQVDVAFGGLRKQRQCSDEISAKILEQQLLVELKEQVQESQSKIWTLAQAYQKVYSSVWKGTKSEATTVKNAKLVLKYFDGNTNLKDITTTWVDDWIASMEDQGNSNATINRKLACLSKIMSFAMERGALDRKPHLERKPEGPGRIRWLSQEEESQLLSLLNQWGKQDHADVISFLLDTGCRPGEAYKLTSRDIRDSQVTFWETKNGESRTIPLTIRAQEILKRRTVNSVRPFPYSDGWMRNQWDRVRTCMGMESDEGFVPYMCRHTCASRLAQKGVPLAVIKQWMGHKTIQITLRYAHLSQESLLMGLAALEPQNTQVCQGS